ncbi:MAG: STAS domain-containing protein [Candidatus Eremiobacteraeota bacterium]|nr:STAS domain-containing protein [Candidatus Eremiobacteraeota bacterium]
MSEQLAQIDVREHQGTPVVSISGDIDLSNAKLLRDALEGVTAQDAVAIDMTELAFIDSTGLNAIAQYGRRMLESGRDVYLIITRPPLRKIFEITSLDQHFTVLTSLDDLP